MLLKNIIGILIIVLNICGIGYLIFLGFNFLKDKYLNKEKPVEAKPKTQKKKPEPKKDIVPASILNDEDDLLKNMDLSDLDDLNFDDFD